MKYIAVQSQIQEGIVKISYKTNQGTGFFVAKDIILTAYHLFFEPAIDDTQLVLYHKKNGLTGRVLAYDIDLDICLIRTETQFEDYLPLQSIGIKVNEDWMTFGFPYQGEQEAAKFSGTVSHHETNERYDLVLNSEKVSGDYNYDGLSGAPIVCNEKVVALVLKQIDDKLGAISINKISAFIEAHNISFGKEGQYADLPAQFANEIRRSVENRTVLEHLEEATHKQGQWVLMTGSPGSGKSLNIAAFEPQDERITIVGKYFVKIPNDNTPKSLRSSKEFFLKWLEELTSFTLYGTTLPKETKTFEQRVERLPKLLQDLSGYFRAKDRIGVFCIDGLDEIEELHAFLGVISFNLPENIKILLSCTSQEILPSDIKNDLKADQIVLVTPIPLRPCEYLIMKEIGEDVLPMEAVQQLALKSEGHPLYLRYLISMVKENEDLIRQQEDFQDWLDDIPAIEGDIEIYYRSIWDTIYEDKNKLWISLCISQLRSPLEKEYVLLTLPPEVKIAFYSTFPSIKHLFKEDHGRLEVYHNSFKEFISERTELFVKDCNDIMVKFCENHGDSDYAIENRLYHYTLCNSPEKALVHCNQEWADLLAIHHIEPDLVLLDIKDTIALAIQLDETTELIRLLLLLQRIEFRYDYVFFEYAVNIALALIANRQYRQALKYIVRRNVLLVSNNRAVTFLQLFYEADAVEEAKILLDAIDARFHKEMDARARTGEGITMDFFTMKSNSLVLSERENKDKAIRELMVFHRFMENFKVADDEIDGKTSSGITMIREFSLGWYHAYLLRTYGIHKGANEMSEMLGEPHNARWAKMFALSKHLYDHDLKQYNTNYFEDDGNGQKFLADIEYLIENHGFIHDKMEIKLLIKSLINDSENSDLVIDLIKKYQEFDDPEHTIRQANGVDLDFLGYKDMGFVAKCNGYVDKDNQFPKIEIRYGKMGWERYVHSLIVNIYFLEGKVYSFKAKGDTEGLDLGQKQLKVITEALNFTFEERSHWERSYLLPETIFPMLYGKLVHLHSHFDSPGLDTFLDHLKLVENHQLGLYSEGYREVLYEIAKALLLVNYDTAKIEPIIHRWKQHVIAGIQNRWERTEELLKISEIYALLNKTNLYEKTFQEVLNTSMGPTWYKEAQLDLLNSTLSNLNKDNINLNEHIQDFASLLDFASGEMTFQRYVRHEKEDFVGSLIINHRTGHALEYFKREIMPPPTLLIDNAEHDNFDAPTPGNGYHLGARCFVEQSAILEILKTIDNISPYLKWALYQIFVINDDTNRYIKSYGEQVAIALNEIEQLDDTHIDSICEDLAEMIANGGMVRDDISVLLNELYKGLTTTNVARIQSHLAIRDIKWGGNSDDGEIPEVVSSETTHEASDFVNFNRAVETGADRSTMIKLGFESFEKEKISIWHSNWSTEHSTAKKNLKRLFHTDHETTRTLSDAILKFDESPWFVAREVLWYLEGKLSKPQVTRIYEIVNDHFHHIIRPDQRSKEKYAWLCADGHTDEGNQPIIEFLIWLLNHPFQSIKQKTAKTLIRLATFLGEELVVCLINNAISGSPELSTTTCSSILDTISEEIPELIVNVLTHRPGLIDGMKSVQHFSIKYNFVSLADNLEVHGFKVLKEAIEVTIPDTVVDSGDVFLEESYLAPIEYEITELNEMGLLDKKFCNGLLASIEEYCAPLTPNELMKSDRYLERSFYDESDVEGRQIVILNYALNKAILENVDKGRMERVFKILNDV